MWSPSLFTTIIPTSTLLLLGATAAAAADNPDDASGKFLYITEPACGYYQCFVDWKQGADVAVNWLGPPAGSVSVMLISTNGGPTYDIVDSIASISQEGYCDSGAGLGVVQPGVECGRIEFTVAGGWQPRDNYTIAVQSLSDPSLIGYTDNINIIKGTNVGSGTIATLQTIAAPTSTDWNNAASFTGKIPDPTAVTGGNGATKTKNSSASSSVTSKSSRQPSSAVESSTKSRSPSTSSSTYDPSSSSSSSDEQAVSTSPASSFTSDDLTSPSSISVLQGGSLAAQNSAVATTTPAPFSDASRISLSIGVTLMVVLPGVMLV